MLHGHMKYIVLNVDGDRLPFVFHEVLKHADMLNTLRATYPNAPLVSAGFMRLFDGHAVNCYGDSVTLMVRADPDDSALITKMLDGELPKR